MERIVPRLIALAGLAVGVLLCLYGLFAILYRGESGGETYVKLGGRNVDADLAGAGALAVGLVAISGSIVLLRRRRAQ